MKPPVPGWVTTTAHQPVYIPTLTGDGIAETIWVDVPAWKDPVSGQVFLDGHSREKIDAVKARYLGILAPLQLRELRNAIGVPQKGMAELLQLGEKSWTRWETGKERPSRSMKLTFGIITDGTADDRINQMVGSIRKQHIPEYEILVVGRCGINASDVQTISFDESRKKNWITRKKNLITQYAKYDIICYLHDYLILSDGWYETVQTVSFDVGITPMLNRDGTRFRDWTLDAAIPLREYLPPERDRERLLPYFVNLSRIQYVSGAYWLAQKAIMEEFPLDERLCAGESEDVEWSQRVRRKRLFTLIAGSDCYVRSLKDKRVSFVPMGQDWVDRLLAMTQSELDVIDRRARECYAKAK